MSESKIIVVRYNKANTLSLPYFDEDGAIQYLKFKPGRNDVDEAIFNAVKEAVLEQVNGEDKWAYYEKHVKVEKEVVIEEDGTEDYSKMNAGDFITLIESTTDIETVEGYFKYEEANKDRTTVKAAITNHLLVLNTPPD